VARGALKLVWIEAAVTAQLLSSTHCMLCTDYDNDNCDPTSALHTLNTGRSVTLEQ
jgi:hypothetical protein